MEYFTIYTKKLKHRRLLLGSSHIWKDVGYGTVIYIATLSTVDSELYDAVSVDGAGYWARLCNVTLPCLRSTIAVVLLLQVSNILKLFYGPAVYETSDVLQTYSFAEGLQNGNIGYAIAIGFPYCFPRVTFRMFIRLTRRWSMCMPIL
jgi:putative aldouronate transport system permease protein